MVVSRKQGHAGTRAVHEPVQGRPAIAPPFAGSQRRRRPLATMDPQTLDLGTDFREGDENPSGHDRWEERHALC